MFRGGAPAFVMLSEAKHLATEREVRGSSDETPHAMPRSFASLRMTESVQGTAFSLHALPRDFVVHLEWEGRVQPGR